MKSKRVSESAIEMREMVMPNQTNPQNTVFGGVVMSWIDMAAAMCASRHCNLPVVTVHIDDIDFLHPIKVGEHVLIKASVNYVGRTSMIVGVRVDSEDPYAGTTRKTTRAYLTFVGLDANGKPAEVARLETETEDDERRFRNAEQRVKHGRSLQSSLKD